MKKLLLFIFILKLGAVPVEVTTEAPSTMIHQQQMMGQLVDSYQKYVEMLEKANEQVNKLNEINNYAMKANNLMTNGNLLIANPMDVLENLERTLNSIKYNINSLSQNAKDWELSNAIKNKRLKEKCPNIDFSKILPDQTEFQTIQTGEETAFGADSKLILETFTDIKANEVESLYGGLKGLPLAILMCEELQKYEQQLTNAQYHNNISKALLQGDFETYKKQKEEQIKYIVAQEAIAQQEYQAKLSPIKVRVEHMKNALGVKDPALATGKLTGSDQEIKFCEPIDGQCMPIQLTLDYVKYKEADMVAKARNNSNQDKSQAQSDREFIMIDYLREIATHLSFLNETVAMTATMLAEEQERQAGMNKKPPADPDMLNKRKTDMKLEMVTQKNAINLSNNPKLDQFGFPTF